MTIDLYNKRYFRIFPLCLITFFLLTGCKKAIDVDAPVNSINAENVYNSDATAASVLTGLYAKLSSTSSQFSNGGGLTTTSLLAGLSADEFKLYSGVTTVKYKAYYQNELSAIGLNGVEPWNNCYPNIFICNSAIEGLEASTALTPSVKQQLKGEALFMRAFFYFYLVNLYGDVPLVTGTDYKINATLARTSKDKVYQQITEDLIDAQRMLSANFLKADVLGVTTERVRPTKWAATALLARVYLYKGEWAKAETEATSVINNNLFSLTSLGGVFLKNSNEAIWQLQPVFVGRNTEDGRNFIIPPTGFSGSTYPVYLSTNLLNSFEAGDQRKLQWVNKYTDTIPNPDVDYYYPYKYKVYLQNAAVSEYLMLLRLGEQYLIRSEARAKQNKIAESQADLNAIRARAGLPSTPANDQPSLLAAILHERQIEIFSELGARWLDLKRTNNVDGVMSVITQIKGGNWQTTDQLYPIPQFDIDKNPKIIQNPGY